MKHAFATALWSFSINYAMGLLFQGNMNLLREEKGLHQGQSIKDGEEGMHHANDLFCGIHYFLTFSHLIMVIGFHGKNMKLPVYVVKIFIT